MQDRSFGLLINHYIYLVAFTYGSYDTAIDPI